MAQYNYILVVGEKEIGTGQVSIYLRLNSITFKTVRLLKTMFCAFLPC